MAKADRHADESEFSVLEREICRFGVPNEDLERLMLMAEAMSLPEAMRIIGAMGPVRKQYVSAFLHTLMAADGRIDPSETEFIDYIISSTNIPRMTLTEAEKFMSEL